MLLQYEFAPAQATPCGLCHRRGLRFPDGGRRCYEHATEDDFALLIDLDDMALAIGLTKSRPWPGTYWNTRADWPYGPNIDVAARARLLKWAHEHHVQLAPRRVVGCLDWLLGRRCSKRCLREGRSGWLDQVTAWTRDDEPAVLVAQPYHLDSDDYAQLQAISELDGVRVELKADGSWYGHRTWFVGVWKEER